MRMKSTNEFYEFTPVLDEVVGEVEDLKIHVITLYTSKLLD